MIRHTVSMVSGVLLLMVCLVSLAACGSPDGNAEDGARWYAMYNCNACHGNNGNDGKAAAIAGLSMGFRSFVKVLRNPDSASMPPFPEEKVSRQDAADIYIWLKGLN